MQRTGLVIVLIFLFAACETDKQRNALSTPFGTYIRYAQILWDNDEVDLSIKVFQRATAQHKPVTYRDKVEYYSFMLSASRVEGNNEAAKLYIDSTLTYAEKYIHLFPNLYINAIFSKADIAMAENNMVEAVRHFYIGKKTVFEYLSECDRVFFLYQISNIFYQQKDYQDAIRNALEAYETGRACDKSSPFHFIHRQSAMNTVGLCYEKLGEYEKAIEHYLIALNFIDEVEPYLKGRKGDIDAARGVIYGNLGNSLALAGQFDRGYEYLQKSQQLLWYRPKYQITNIFSELKMSNLFILQEQWDKVGFHLDKVDSWIGDNDFGLDVNYRKAKARWQYYEGIGNVDLAYKWHQKLLAATEKSHAYLQSLKSIDFDAEMQRMKSEDEVYQLRKIRENQSIFIALTSLLAGFALLTIYLLWLNYKNYKKTSEKTRRLYNEIKKKNDELLQSLEALESSQNENTRLLKVVAHDLRNPLGATVNICQLLEQEENLNPDQKDLISTIKTASANSLQFIRDLLHVQISEKQHVPKEPIKLSKLIHDCRNILQHKAEDKSQSILLTIEPSEIMGNRERLWRLISNLLANAIKFSPEGSTIHISLEKKENGVLIMVQDEGIGIPPEWKEKLFTFRPELKRQGTKGETSFGMGLTISHQIVGAHNGEIWFENNEPNGTRFYVFLPYGY